MMVSHVVDNHDHSPARAHAHCAQLPQELEASFGIEAPGLAPIHQLAIPQANGAEIPDAPSCWMMQQHRVLRFWRNPHPASRTMLLEMDFIHGPKVNRLVSCQTAKFFLPALDPRGLRWRSQASVSSCETRVAGTFSDIAEFRDSHPIASRYRRTGSCRPRGSPPARIRMESCATPRQ